MLKRDQIIYVLVRDHRETEKWVLTYHTQLLCLANFANVILVLQPTEFAYKLVCMLTAAIELFLTWL